MTDEARIRAERSLNALLFYLFEFRAQGDEIVDHRFERCVDSVNAYFDSERFTTVKTSQYSFRVSCECGWNLSVMPPLDSTVAGKALERSVRQMVFHFEIYHVEG